MDVVNRRFPAPTGCLVLALGLTGLAGPAAAEPVPALKIALQIAGRGTVPLNIVTLAKGVVTRIYRHAGVNVIWADAASSTGRPGSRDLDAVGVLSVAQDTGE